MAMLIGANWAGSATHARASDESFKRFSADGTLQATAAGAATLRLANPRNDGIAQIHLILGQARAEHPDYWELRVLDERPQGDPWGKEGLVIGFDEIKSAAQWTSPPLLGATFLLELRHRASAARNSDLGTAGLSVIGATGPRPPSIVPQAPVSAFFTWAQLQEFQTQDKAAVANAAAAVVSILYQGNILCSGVAVGDDLVATAAHCLSPPRQFVRDGKCNDLAIVVGYVFEEASEARQTRLVCEAAEALGCGYSECEGERLKHSDYGDVAILRVRGTRPLKSLKIAEGGALFERSRRADVWIIGNLRPAISPQLEFYRCDAEPQQVRAGHTALLDTALHFDHRCWTYGGASGAPVLRLDNELNPELVGIHNGWDPGRFDCSDAFKNCQTGEPRADPEPYFRNSASFSILLRGIMQKK